MRSCDSSWVHGSDAGCDCAGSCASKLTKNKPKLCTVTCLPEWVRTLGKLPSGASPLRLRTTKINGAAVFLQVLPFKPTNKMFFPKQAAPEFPSELRGCPPPCHPAWSRQNSAPPSQAPEAPRGPPRSATIDRREGGEHRRQAGDGILHASLALFLGVDSIHDHDRDHDG